MQVSLLQAFCKLCWHIIVAASIIAVYACCRNGWKFHNCNSFTVLTFMG